MKKVMWWSAGGYVVVAHEIIMSALGLVIVIARSRPRPRSLTIYYKLSNYLSVIFLYSAHVIASIDQFNLVLSLMDTLGSQHH